MGVGGGGWGVYPHPWPLYPPVPPYSPVPILVPRCPSAIFVPNFCPKKCPIFVPTGRVIKYPKKCARGGVPGAPRCPGGPPVQTPALRHGVRGVGGVAGGTPRRPGEVVGIPRMAGGYPRSPVSMPVRAGDVTAPGGTPGPPGGGLDGRWRSAPCGCRVGGPTPLVVSLPLPAVRVRSTTCTRDVRTQ